MLLAALSVVNREGEEGVDTGEMSCSQEFQFLNKRSQAGGGSGLGLTEGSASLQGGVRWPGSH